MSPIVLQPTTILLRRLERVACLAPSEQQAVLDLPIRTQALAPGADIATSCGYAERCCLVLEGWLYRYQLLGEGRRQIFGFHVPGDIPDLENLHLPPRDDNGLAALGEAVVAVIQHRDLRTLTAAFPNLADALWRCTLLDAAIARTWLASLGRRSASERFAHFFCELYIRLEAVGLAANHHCPLPMSQTILADALGITSVHVNRTLQEMRKQGLIALQNKTLTLHAWDELVRIAEFDPAYLQPLRQPAYDPLHPIHTGPPGER